MIITKHNYYYRKKKKKLEQKIKAQKRRHNKTEHKTQTQSY